MTHRLAPILISTIALSSCVHTQETQEPVAQAAASETHPAAADEIALAVSSMPPAPSVPPVAKPSWIKRTETQGVTDKDGKIVMNAGTIQPLYQDAQKTDTVFTQVNVASSAQTETPSGTSNVGLGYRRLIERDLMVGVNGFYDRDWARTADRTGADAELRWRSFNLSTNYYAGQSAPDGRKALDGYDIQLGCQVPYLPGAQATLTRADFFTEGLSVSETYTAGMKLDLVKYIQIEAGVRSDGTNPEAGVVKLNFNLLPSQWGPQRKTAFGRDTVSSTPLEQRDLSGSALDKVKRNNAIATGN
jgi:hypothetical protein